MRNILGKSNKKVNVVSDGVILAGFRDLYSSLDNEGLQKLEPNFQVTNYLRANAGKKVEQ